jgi:hypothetical protein
VALSAADWANARSGVVTGTQADASPASRSRKRSEDEGRTLP